MRRIPFFAVPAALALLACTAAANIPLGATAPDFNKTQLGGGLVSLSQFTPNHNKVVVLFIFGYSCDYCWTDGPSFESEIWQHYQQTRPGEVQCLGADIYNGNTAAVTNFRDITGATFPLLMNAASSIGGDIETLYGPRDDFVVISKQGIVRYHAALKWPIGAGYHSDEIRGAVDSLVSPTVSVFPGQTDLSLSAGPNPFRSGAAITLSLPRPVTRARLAIYDVTGREVALLHEGSLAAGQTPFDWNGRDAAGGACPAGVFLVSATLDGRRLERRLVRLP